MKKILLASLWVAVATALPNIGKTQAPDTSTIEKLQRYVAGPLDKTQVPTGFLEDYGAPFIPMAAFNGNLSDSNLIEINLWRLLYFQIQTSYCQAGTNPLPSIVAVNESLKTANTAATVPGGLANGSMHTLQARIQTPCGQIVTALPEGRYRATCSGGGGGSLSVVASPNPTTGSINLSFEDPGDSTSSFISSAEILTPVSSLNSTGKTIISLFEFNIGSLRKQWIMNEINSKTYHFNLAGLRKGLYVLQVDRDNKTATTKIILE